MAMCEAPHGGIIKSQQNVLDIELRPPFYAYGLDPTVLHGGIITPPENYNGSNEELPAKSITGKYFPPIPFVPEHGGVQETLPDMYYVPPSGDQP